MSENWLAATLDDVRTKTLRVLGGLTEEQARFAPPGLQNTILWHAGHAYIVVERLTAAATGGEPHEPAGWYGLFSWESRPADVPADRWPPLAEVVDALREQQGRLSALYAGLTPEALALTNAAMGQERTASWTIVHALLDEASHVGEIMLLRKLQGLGRG